MIFHEKILAAAPDVLAPDGSEVRILCSLAGGSMAHFRLAPGAVSIAVAHRTVEEVWFFLEGRGQMWRKLGPAESVIAVEPGLSITIPLGTHFQFRAEADTPLAAVGVTMPPWPGPEEAYPVAGIWTPDRVPA